MSATKRHMNWTTVQLGSQVFTGVSQVAFDNGGSLAKFAADGDKYNTTVVNDFNDPSASLTTADLAAAYACPVGTRGSFSAVANDAKNGVSTGQGGRTYTLANAIVAENSLSGQHRQFMTAQLSFSAESSDGTTNPLSSAAV